MERKREEKWPLKKKKRERETLRIIVDTLTIREKRATIAYELAEMEHVITGHVYWTGENGFERFEE